MSLRKLALSLSLLSFGLVMVASSPKANADFETFSANYGSQANPLTVPFNTSLSLTKFDTSMGTLTGVTFTLTVNANVTSRVFNPDAPNIVQYTNVTGATQVSISGPAGLAEMVSAGIGPFSGSSSLAIITVGQGFASATGSTGVGSANFGTYQGVGSGSYLVATSAVNTVGGNVDQPNASINAKSASYGTLTVRYDFTPSTVPEPASFAMVALGLGGVFAARRYRRRAA